MRNAVIQTKSMGIKMANPKLLAELETQIKVSKFWRIFNRVTGDWSNALSILSAVAIPSLLLLKPHLSESTQIDVDFYVIIISLFALMLTLLNAIYKMKPRSLLNFTILEKAKILKFKYENDKISDKKIEEIVRKIIDRS